MGTYYPICTFPPSSECLIGISDAFSAFCLRVSVILPTCSLYPHQKRAYSALHPQAWTYIYRSMPEGSYRVQSPGFPKLVYSTNEQAKPKPYQTKEQTKITNKRTTTNPAEQQNNKSSRLSRGIWTELGKVDQTQCQR